MKRILAAVVLGALSAAPARADLRYTVHLESATRSVAAPPAAGAGKVLAPYDRVEAVVTVSTDAARIVYAQDVLFVPRGAAMIRHVTGGVIVNANDRTYSIIDSRAAAPTLGSAATFTRTGQKQEIAGVPAERVTVSIVRPDLLRIEGEMWLTDSFAAYQAMEAAFDPVTMILSHETGWPGGFVLRADLGGTAFGQKHLVKYVTAIGEVASQPDAFAIPSGYRQIPITSQVPQLPPISRADAHDVGAPGVVAPKPTTRPKPSYTREALSRRISGTVRVSAIVEANGRIKEAKIVRSVDAVYGLDDSALENVKEWRFTPGTFNGVPAPIIVSIDVQFSTSLP
jgi:TonB family protein